MGKSNKNNQSILYLIIFFRNNEEITLKWKEIEMRESNFSFGLAHGISNIWGVCNFFPLSYH